MIAEEKMSCHLCGMKKLLSLAAMLAIFLAACNGSSTAPSNTANADSVVKPDITEADASYRIDTATAISFVAYDASRKGPLPVVLVIPEWWGLTDYPKMRARELAKLGYFAMAVDMYGNRKVASGPDEADKLATPFHSDTALVKRTLMAAINKIRSYRQADASRMAMIGYCFGGTMSLFAARMGLPLKGVVSFHGSLNGTAGKTSIPILVCHGEADKYVSPQDVAAWRKTMDSLGVKYTFKAYPGATHAFTNPQATENGKKFHMPIEYNAAADTASWNEMKAFLGKVL
jgi:dienelactone hydrolase